MYVSGDIRNRIFRVIFQFEDFSLKFDIHIKKICRLYNIFKIFFRLTINCDNAQYGCTRVLNLDALTAHLEECDHNPKRPVLCEQVSP